MTCFDGQSFLVGREASKSESSGDEEEGATPRIRPARFILLAAAIRIELLEGARGGSAGVDNWAGMRVKNRGDGAALPESIRAGALEVGAEFGGDLVADRRGLFRGLC